MILLFFIFIFVTNDTFWRNNNTSNFDFSNVSVGKVNMNLVGTLGGQKKKYPIVFKSIKKNHRKVQKNWKFYSNPVFDEIDYFILLYLTEEK